MARAALLDLAERVIRSLIFIDISPQGEGNNSEY
jgi:hypothetical protein